MDLAIIGVGNPMESLTYRKMGYITKKEEKVISIIALLRLEIIDHLIIDTEIVKALV